MPPNRIPTLIAINCNPHSLSQIGKLNFFVPILLSTRSHSNPLDSIADGKCKICERFA
jgi:hypothetical protein